MATPANTAVEFTDRTAPHFPRKDYWAVESGRELPNRGSVHKPGSLPLPCDIIWEKNVPVTLRDGATIYVDIYRPEGYSSVPAIISGGPYGKNGGPFSEFTDQAPFRFGIPQKSVSGFEKFEGLDPAIMCFHGYAMVHSDPRGVGRSDGNTIMTSAQDGRDNYDLVEFLAAQPWCNGRVSMAGNSWLTQTQWFCGAERPPHLACLAISEGWSDFYNDTACRGGVPYVGFWDWLLKKCTIGNGQVEDVTTMVQNHPLWNDYWEERRARLENINVPLLVVASWCSQLHTGGTFRGWQKTSSKQKWLRVHNSNEWPDLYAPANVEETRAFFDHFLKGHNNGWEYTPRVRVCVLNPGGKDVVNRPETSFPLEREKPTQLYLDATNHKMTADAPKSEKSVTFDAQSGSTTFSHVFSERAELTGYWGARLYVEAIGNNDIDLFVKWNKTDSKTGQTIEHVNIDVGHLQPNPEQARQKL